MAEKTNTIGGTGSPTNATSLTAHFNLPIFQTNDVPSWITDWNGTMMEIDDLLFKIQSTGEVNEQQYETLTGLMATAQQNITDMRDNITALTTDLGSTKKVLDLMGADISTVKSDLIAQNALVKTMQTTLTNLEDDFNSFKNTTLPGINSKIQDALDDSADALGEVGSLETKVNANTQHVTELMTLGVVTTGTFNFSGTPGIIFSNIDKILANTSQVMVMLCNDAGEGTVYTPYIWNISTNVSTLSFYSPSGSQAQIRIARTNSTSKNATISGWENITGIKRLVLIPFPN